VSSTDDSKISGSDSDWDNDDDANGNVMVVKKLMIEAWNCPKKYAKTVEILDFLDVFGNLDENEWGK
jgi:hypothetical protein